MVPELWSFGQSSHSGILIWSASLRKMKVGFAPLNEMCGLLSVAASPPAGPWLAHVNATCTRPCRSTRSHARRSPQQLLPTRESRGRHSDLLPHFLRSISHQDPKTFLLEGHSSPFLSFHIHCCYFHPYPHYHQQICHRVLNLPTSCESLLPTSHPCSLLGADACAG